MATITAIEFFISAVAVATIPAIVDVFVTTSRVGRSDVGLDQSGLSDTRLSPQQACIISDINLDF